MTSYRAATHLWRLPLAIAGGLISSLAFPRENLWPMIFIAVAMLLLSVRGLRFLAAFGIGVAGGLAFYLSQVEWLTVYLGPIPWLALSTLESLIFGLGMAVSALVWSWLERNLESTWKNLAIAGALATIWTAREWVACNLPYGGFPWSRVAQSLSDSFLASLTYYLGISGLTFLAVLATVLVMQLISKQRPQLSTLAALLLITATALGTSPPIAAETGTLRVGAIQGNANAGLFSNVERGAILDNHIDETRVMLAELEKNDLDLVVWPENASDLSPLSSDVAYRKIEQLVNEELGVPLAFGALTQREGGTYNSSLFWLPNRGIVDIYDKKRPVPFAEYVPDRDFWYQLAPDLIGLITWDYSFGTADGIFELGENRLGALICFEIAIDDIGRELVADEAELILSQTNNADFGRTDESFQQAALARLRAIETGRAVVNISTVGLSVVYLPNGQIVDQVPTFEPAHMVIDVPLRNSLTPAMIVGNRFDLAINFAALVLFVLALRERSRRLNRSHEASDSEPQALTVSSKESAESK